MFFEYGTDETEQWRRGSTRCVGNTIGHVQVHRFRVGGGGGVRQAIPVPVPPTCIKRTTGASLFAAADHALSNFAFGGRSLQSFLAEEVLPKVDCFLLTVVVDACSANTVMFEHMAAAVRDAASTAAAAAHRH